MVWRVSLRFVFRCVPFFSEAGRKSNRVLFNSKLFGTFFSAAEADRLQMQWLPLYRDACRVDGRVSLRGVLFLPDRIILKERFFFD